MILGVLLPVSAITIIISVFSAILAISGIDPTYLAVTFLQEIFTGLFPIIKVMIGIWVMYSVLYFLIAFAAISAIQSLTVVPIAWIYAGSVFLRMHSRILRDRQYIVTFSSSLIYALLRTDSLSAFMDGGKPPHPNTGWHAGVSPHLA